MKLLSIIRVNGTRIPPTRIYSGSLGDIYVYENKGFCMWMYNKLLIPFSKVVVANSYNSSVLSNLMNGITIRLNKRLTYISMSKHILGELYSLTYKVPKISNSLPDSRIAVDALDIVIANRNKDMELLIKMKSISHSIRANITATYPLIKNAMFVNKQSSLFKFKYGYFKLAGIIKKDMYTMQSLSKCEEDNVKVYICGNRILFHRDQAMYNLMLSSKIANTDELLHNIMLSDKFNEYRYNIFYRWYSPNKFLVLDSSKVNAVFQISQVGIDAIVPMIYKGNIITASRGYCSNHAIYYINLMKCLSPLDTFALFDNITELVGAVLRSEPEIITASKLLSLKDKIAMCMIRSACIEVKTEVITDICSRLLNIDSPLYIESINSMGLMKYYINNKLI